MPDQTSPNQTVDLINVLLPILTFMLGYVTSVYERRRESREKLKNLKAILFKEMSENFKFLNTVMPKDEDSLSQQPQLIASFAGRLSTIVYERYLDKLDTLKPIELDKIFDAYSSQRELQRNSMEFEEAFKNHESKQSIAAKAVGVVALAQRHYKDMKEALILFKKGNEYVNRLSQERGSALAVYGEFSQMVGEQS